MIQVIADQLTLEEKIAQLFILGFQGTSYNETLAQYNDLNIGGVLMFANNIGGSEEVKTLNETIQSNAQSIPMFIAVDQEGGRVNRLPSNIPNIESAYQIGLSGSTDHAYQSGAFIGKNLKRLGFNVDFAPSLDIWSNPGNKVIGDRSFGQTSQDVIRYGLPFNKGINEQQIITSAKHFPGHGDTFVDSHDTLPVSNLTLEQLQKKELMPFKAAIAQNIDMIMVSHILFPDIDATHPSSLSPKMIQSLLQKQMKYNGIVITDDLAMGAIKNSYSREAALTQALNAGETMLLIGSDIGDIKSQIQYLKVQVETGKIDRKIIEENVQKILKLKHKYGIV
ncbi:glycoside hydrolase family 3 N-terminal domain-containing protein [Macrococcus capreoli]|uniref:glycoside hydrolase family 3 N-terminal domain-containing protein n=1 Tax=Macrococcus capreoli TaxID=2982690 RepID=UPI003EE7C5A4